ncbi:hypothetical protein [Dactylosporangium sp. CA-233914]|uniref:hypothetical protein n=1 Tax=Dactylosporangium sp. CA-233914 TaxID=3239934 RepID=UPI003D8DE89B
MDDEADATWVKHMASGPAGGPPVPPHFVKLHYLRRLSREAGSAVARNAPVQRRPDRWRAPER